MTLPSDHFFPSVSNLGENLPQYNEELNVSLIDMYQNLSSSINGSVRGSNLSGADQWLPEIQGDSTAGTTTYDIQQGFCMQVGLMVNVWFDIRWTATTATGNLLIILPFQVFNSVDVNFTGQVYGGNFSHDATRPNLFLSALPLTTTAALKQSGPNVSINDVTVPATGRLIGQLTYMGEVNG